MARLGYNAGFSAESSLDRLARLPQLKEEL
jgi:hypothetical protein